MDARLTRAALVVAACLSLGANFPQYSSVRSEHFIVTAPTPELARDVCQSAEQYRKEMALEWLGHELPPWRGVCPITVKMASGAGGATSFMFDNGVPFGWTMNVQGPRERILDSVLPHEITHTVFATHFGRPLPRWADEGACTTVEHPSEKAKQDRFLIDFLHTDRGIPFNQMFAMKEYPQDILPLYSQGYSLTRFLIQQGGKRKFVEYVGDGMNANNWAAATRKYYGFGSLSDLQVTWVKWVGQGSPDMSDKSIEGVAVAQVDQPRQTTAEQVALARQNSAYGWQAPPAQNARTFAEAESFVRPPAPSNFAAAAAVQPGSGQSSSVSRPVSDGWYARQRDQAQAASQSPPPPPTRAPLPPGSIAPGSITPASFEAPLAAPATTTQAPGNRRVLMEWRRDPSQPAAQRTDVRGLAVQDATLLR